MWRGENEHARQNPIENARRVVGHGEILIGEIASADPIENARED